MTRSALLFALLLVPVTAAAQQFCGARSISCSTTVRGIGRCPDIHNISLSAGTQITIVVKGPEGTSPQLILTDGTFNEVVATAFDDGPGTTAALTYTARFDHGYIIVVGGVGDTHEYELTVSCHDGSATACAPDAVTLCLAENRFRAQVTWVDYELRTGRGNVVPVDSADSGLFWFFQPNNWELMVKVIDGCALNDRFWVYGAASTDVEYILTVTDTKTGQTKLYRNDRGTPARAITDANAFAACP